MVDSLNKSVKHSVSGGSKILESGGFLCGNGGIVIFTKPSGTPSKVAII